MFFNGFPGFGGFGGDDDDSQGSYYTSSRSKKPVDTTKYQELLGVEKNCTQKEITKAFRKKSIKLHPDRPGGNIDKFQELSNAHDVLSDPDKRDLQDKGGEDAVKEGHAGGGGHQDLFDLLSGRGGGQKTRGKQKMKDCAHELGITLEDIMNGKTKKLAITRDRLCTDCNGQGGEGVATCPSCKGRGMVTKMQQLGPGMYTQSSGPCTDCRGEGETVKKRCKKCNGRKVCKEKKILEVQVDKGVTDKHQQKFSGEADEAPGYTAGDVVIQVKEKTHNIFKRKQADIAMTVNITLKEALCGFERIINHLDGKNHVMQTEPGSVIGSGDVKTIMYAGLPLFRNPALTGNLFVHFEIEFPKSGSLSEQHINMLKQLLPGETIIPKVSEDVEQHQLVKFEKSHINQNKKQGGGEAYDEDDGNEYDDFGGGSRRVVNCANQ